MEELYVKSDLRHSPDENVIKDLLMECIEMHYGKISTELVKVAEMDVLIEELKTVLSKYGA